MFSGPTSSISSEIRADIFVLSAANSSGHVLPQRVMPLAAHRGRLQSVDLTSELLDERGMISAGDGCSSRGVWNRNKWRAGYIVNEWRVKMMFSPGI